MGFWLKILYWIVANAGLIQTVLGWFQKKPVKPEPIFPTIPSIPGLPTPDDAIKAIQDIMRRK